MKSPKPFLKHNRKQQKQQKNTLLKQTEIKQI